MSTTYRIYIPAAGALSYIQGASAIVGSPRPDGLVEIDYEGNLFKADHLDRYEERLLHALGRHRVRYPTVARSVAPAEELQEVGHFVEYAPDQYDGVISDPEALQRWLVPEDLSESRWLMVPDKEARRREAARLLQKHRHLTLSPAELTRVARDQLYL